MQTQDGPGPGPASLLRARTAPAPAGSDDDDSGGNSPEQARDSSVSLAPRNAPRYRWVPDADQTECKACKQPFTLLRRRVRSAAACAGTALV